MTFKRTVQLLMTLMVLSLLGLLFVVTCGCGGEIEKPPQPPTELPEPPNDAPPSGPYCGDHNCDEDIGEDYWNCLDCVDPLTGGPKNGYCGDGLCYKETMMSCWKDCRPKAYNPDPEFRTEPSPLPPGDNPVPPIPGPSPNPMNPPKELPKRF